MSSLPKPLGQPWLISRIVAEIFRFIAGLKNQL